jgi:hypothetical protein
MLKTVGTKYLFKMKYMTSVKYYSILKILHYFCCTLYSIMDVSAKALL